MATYYKALENIPDERYHDIIVNPLLDCLKDRGILLDSSQSPKTNVSFDDVTSEFFLLAGGSICFWRTTVPTLNSIDNSVMDRTTGSVLQFRTV